MHFLYAVNPKWGNRDRTAVDIVVRFEGIDEDLPFTANVNDTTDYGRDLYAKAVAGEFGVISEFDPKPPAVELVTKIMREHRNHKLQTEVDVIASNQLRWNSLTTEQKKAYEEYRTALLDCTSDPAFPWYNSVVVEVNFGFSINPTLAPWPVAPTKG
jgi:hypothetical protein